MFGRTTDGRRSLIAPVSTASTPIAAAGAPPRRTIATTIARKLQDTLTRSDFTSTAICSLATAKTNSNIAVVRSQFASGAVTIAATTDAAKTRALTTATGLGERFTRESLRRSGYAPRNLSLERERAGQ